MVVKVFIYLSDVAAHGGCTALVPGSRAHPNPLRQLKSAAEGLETDRVVGCCADRWEDEPDGNGDGAEIGSGPYGMPVSHPPSFPLSRCALIRVLSHRREGFEGRDDAGDAQGGRERGHSAALRRALLAHQPPQHQQHRSARRRLHPGPVLVRPLRPCCLLLPLLMAPGWCFRHKQSPTLAAEAAALDASGEALTALERQLLGLEELPG